VSVQERDDPSSKDLYDALLSDYPDHAAGTRPVHAVGIGAEGYFVPSDVAPSFSVAEQFGVGRTRVTFRFSNGSGSPVERDDALDVRGLAVKFHLSHDDADLIMITLPVFFASTPEEFAGFAKSGVPKAVKGESWWGRLADQLELRAPSPPPDPQNPDSGAAGVLQYANRHLSARPGTVAALMLVTPTSYARATYHALHTFKLSAPDGAVRYARFSWEPVSGVRPEAAKHPADDYLQSELRERLARGPITFVLRMVVAGQGDVLDDPAQLWDTTRQRVVMGELVLTNLVENQLEGCERLSFNPTRVVAGFECSNDPILAARRGAYEYSCQLRGGSGCPVGGDRT
jgi:catalase